MRTFYSEALTTRELYRLITGAIVPRPVAWVSTIDASGTTNLAPFSFFTCVSTDPPLLAITMAPRSGQKKDTLRNIELNGEFVVNIASDSLAHPMSVSAGDFPYGRSEFVEAGLTPAPSELIAPPRVAEAPIAIECRRYDIIEIGKGPQSIVIGEMIAWHFREDVADVDGRTDFHALRPLSRLSGSLYAGFGSLIDEKELARSQ